MYKPHHIASPDRSRKQATFLSRVPVHCITPFCSDALVSPPNLYPLWWRGSAARFSSPGHRFGRRYYSCFPFFPFSPTHDFSITFNYDASYVSRRLQRGILMSSWCSLLQVQFYCSCWPQQPDVNRRSPFLVVIEIQGYKNTRLLSLFRPPSRQPPNNVIVGNFGCYYRYT